MSEAARASETLVNFYQTTRRCNPEDSHLRRREKIKSYIIKYYDLNGICNYQTILPHNKRHFYGSGRVLQYPLARSASRLSVCTSVWLLLQFWIPISHDNWQFTSKLDTNNMASSPTHHDILQLTHITIPLQMKSKVFWGRSVIICKSVFLDIVHRLYFNKITTFRKLDLLPSSGKKRKDRNPTCWAPWLS
jgi:hypothetical protein